MPRPTTTLQRTDLLEAKDRNARSQGPRTQRESDLQPPTKKKRSSLQKFVNFPKKLSVLRKKNDFKKFLQALSYSPRQNKTGHDLGPFSTSQKIVLSSSRKQDIFEDLKASSPRTWLARLRTSKCVLKNALEAKNFLRDYISVLYKCSVIL